MFSGDVNKISSEVFICNHGIGSKQTVYFEAIFLARYGDEHCNLST